MTDFTLSLAGIPIGISALHPETKDYCADYLCDAAPRLSIVMTDADIALERDHAVRQRAAEGLPPRQFSDRYLEILALLRKITGPLLDHGVVLFHGSVVAVDGRAFLFTAPSGTGKTTHTRLWLEQLPQAHVLNGDKPFLRVDADGKVLACGTPWRGKERYGCNEDLPLEAICLLERSADNHIRQIAPKEAMNVLLKQTHVPGDAGAMLKTLNLVDRISRGVHLYRLGCNMEPEAARVSIGAMIEEPNRHE